MYPDYGTPGAPNMDPYYVSPAEQEDIAAREQQAEDDLHVAVHAAVTDAASVLLPDAVRRVVEAAVKEALRG